MAKFAQLAAKEVADANALASQEGLEHIQAILQNEAPEMLEKKVHTRREGLPDLPNLKGKPVLRFAPNPNGPLSFGHSRGLVINGQYAKDLDGELILRFDDTDTTVNLQCLKHTILSPFNKNGCVVSKHTES